VECRSSAADPRLHPRFPLTPSEFAGTLVKEGEFQEIKKADYEGKWVVLFSYPMDFSEPCFVFSSLFATRRTTWTMATEGGLMTLTGGGAILVVL
jgi:hypothetical protein